MNDVAALDRPLWLKPDTTALSSIENLVASLSEFLKLLQRWNARTNLTAIREDEAIVRRHFGESLFLALNLRPLLTSRASVLDFGSGAGFPGIPMQLLYPDLQVTLAESQGKKAAFLREAARVLKLGCEVWDRRVEEMPTDRLFDAVIFRAVDDPQRAIHEAAKKLRPYGVLAFLAGNTELASADNGLIRIANIRVPGGDVRWLKLYRADVPRGTSA